MIRRPRRTWPAIVIAVVVLAACVAVTVSLVQRLTGTKEYVSYDSVAGELHGITWNELPVLIGGIVALLIGVVLLVIALLPGRAKVLPLTGSDDGIQAGVSRSGLRTLLRSSAGRVDGVTSARVKVRRDTVTVIARTDRHDNAGLADAICATVTDRVHQLGRPVKRVKAKLHAPEAGGPR
ncbi:DUF2964 family protein [Nocardia cyriacigeorgica]|uniref:DUF6286 domain-containing protein n=1 Tax=Nocardia cyriacigeorgica TaxID=135487 RepID=UPI001894B665|nr:DUF6286 domain-containing protein [Nocardia cyriacigeorgica]MBF6086874.1 DUF2964 family protein [Nocardia cyriacigeorgica]MBF6090802.1 DUF2964 family protein [Nocardia cyriacigeorgica]MBF6395587.1 DUF2964 family protein [Nocardia cyriacigeorgica]MBF6401219.1 DUF2964 family protein [Nocardia cyriacigeorgica]